MASYRKSTTFQNRATKKKEQFPTMTKKNHSIFPTPKPLIAMIHVEALPGTPANRKSIQQILAKALHEAERYTKAGVDALMIENMHDAPYLNREVGPEVVAAMSVIGYEVKRASGLPCGIQVLAGANRAALAVAQAGGLDFIRAEGFLYGHIGDEGWMQSDAGALLRYRKTIGAEQIAIFTDIKKKHSAHAVTADVDIVEMAKVAEFFRSDGLILTGNLTGQPADVEEVKKVRASTELPIFIGSGINANNASTFLPWCDGAIVGSSLKVGGHWAGEVDEERVQALVQAFK